MTLNKHIVLVEDDADLNKMMTDFLQQEGYQVTPILDGQHAASIIVEQQPDLVVLDIMLPNVDGIEVCRRIRPTYTGPVLMLTAKNDDIVEVASLQQGADNYLKKPIRPHVLLAHIESMLRRNQPEKIQSAEHILQEQDLHLDLSSYRLTMGEQEVVLTSGEFELLELLMKNAGNPISREMLYQQVRGIEYDGLDRSIDLRISSLRKKLDDEIPPYRYIKTLRGKGYLFSKR